MLDKGKPEDIMAAVKGTKDSLPAAPLSGMFNKSGGKVRLTFKLEQDQLWIGTKGEMMVSLIFLTLSQNKDTHVNVLVIIPFSSLQTSIRQF